MTKNILCTVSGLQPEFGDMRALHQWCRHFFGTDSRVDVDLCTGVNVTIFERGPNPIPHVMMFDFWRYPDTVPTAAEISAGLHTDSRWVSMAYTSSSKRLKEDAGQRLSPYCDRFKPLDQTLTGVVHRATAPPPR